MQPNPSRDPDLSDLRRVHSIVRSIVPRHFDTEDLAVEILIESWSNSHTQPSYMFIRQRCINAMRSQGRENEMLEHQVPHDPEISPSHEAEMTDLVESLMAVLTATEKKVVWLRFIGDYSINEIARRTKLQINVVREHLASAVFKMKESSWS